MIICCDVFFFKQKTAYEMRISDWSSDVCSSDLADQRLGDIAVHGGYRLDDTLAEIARLVAIAQLDRLVRAGRGARGNRGAAEAAVFQQHIDFDRGIAAAVEDFAAEIGRAHV